MDNIFSQRFTLSTDTSQCSEHSGADEKHDVWFFSDISFESGKIYALVSEYGMGCGYLTSLLGGKAQAPSGLRVLCQGQEVSQEELKENSFCLDIDVSDFGGKYVRKSIEKALSKSGVKSDIKDIAKRFGLTPERLDRKFSQCGNEGARAIAALGYAMGRKIFYTGYHPSYYYSSRIDSMWLVALKELTDSGAVVLLPAGSDIVVKHFADEVIYLRQSTDIENFDINQILAAYSKVTDRKDIFKL